MGELADFIRTSLLNLKVGDTANFPLSQKNTLYLQSQDLSMFSDQQYKAKVDKTRNEVVVTRLQ